MKTPLFESNCTVNPTLVSNTLIFGSTKYLKKKNIMNFKSAVIIFALYFVTVTQSVGINEDQFNKIIPLLRKHECGKLYKITMDDVETIALKIGMNNIPDFKYNEGVANTRKLIDLLVFVANNDKKTDNLMLRSLSSYEVKIYVDLFSKICDQRGDGLLEKDQVRQVIDGLDRRREAKQCSFDNGKKINVVEFLNRILEVKPEGEGLDRSQVVELMQLHDEHKTYYGDHIDPDAITQFFKKLSIVKNDYKGFFAYGSNRNAALELQELLIVTAEYNKTAKVEHIYSTSDVRWILWRFSEKDTDKDGLLNKDELFLTGVEKIDSLIKKYDTNKDGYLNIAEFFMVKFEKYNPKSIWPFTFRPFKKTQ